MTVLRVLKVVCVRMCASARAYMWLMKHVIAFEKWIGENQSNKSEIV